MTLALPAPTASYDALKEGARCYECPLKGRRVVPPAPAASGKTRLVIVGMNPGRQEEKHGIPFVGPSGKILDAVLGEANFSRADVHVTNAALCASDSDDQVKPAVACCSARLARELKALPSRAPIAPLGAEATKAVLGRGAIFKTRGFVWSAPEVAESALRNSRRLVEKRAQRADEEKLRKATESLWLLECRAELAGRTVIPSIHPAFLLRGADTWRPALAVDIDRACRWAKRKFPLEDEVKFTETANPSIARSVLRTFSDTVTVDIETNDSPDPLRAQIVCVGVCDVNDMSKVLVFRPLPRKGESQEAFERRRERLWRPTLSAAFSKRVVVTHNGPSFDQIALEDVRGIEFGKCEDTLIAYHAIASHMRMGLDHVGSMYCDLSPWKIKAKAGGAEEKGLAGFGVSDEKIAAYNAADVVVDAKCWLRMQLDLESERHTYEADMANAALCRRMQVRGIRMDVGRRNDLSRRLRRRAAALKGEMRSLTHNPNFSPTKLTDIRKAIFGRFRAPLSATTITPTGLPSTGSALLEALRKGETKAGELADFILRWRSAQKCRSTFLDGVDVHLDGRVHPSWRAFGTVTGRLSCRSPNLQNLIRRVLLEALRLAAKRAEKKGPEELARVKAKIAALANEAYELDTRVRECYIPAPGCEFVYFDLSQSEMRAAAYISGDEKFIATCESGDVHSGNACILFPDEAEIIRKDPKGAGKEFRDVTKNAGFGILYLAEIVTIFQFLQSQGFDVSLHEVEMMFAEIHTAYSRYYEYCDENIAFCRENGYLRTELLGRIRWLGWFPKPTEVANFKVQSFIGDLMNMKLLELEPRLPKGAGYVAQIHDAVIIETPTKLVDDVKGIIKETWAQPITIPSNGRQFVMPIDLKSGERWSDFG